MASPPSDPSSAAPADPGPVDEAARRRFEAAWREGYPQPLDGFLPDPADPLFIGTLVELVQIELELTWKAGKPSPQQPPVAGAEPESAPPRVESYLARFPQLAAAPILLRLLRQEYEARQRFGDRPGVDEYRSRFPDLVRTAEDLREPAEPSDPTTSTTSAPAAPLPKVPGYELLGVLGYGGMGVVYRATQLSLKRDVALKMLSAGPLARPEAFARFRLEAESIARLQDPNIVQVFEVGEWEGHPYLALELVDGGSLAQRLGGNPQPPALAARWAETLARAAHRLHQHGIVHRDLKPANVLLTRDGVLKISDFGLAKRLEELAGEGASSASRPAETETGVVLGTPAYASPEQTSGVSRRVGPATDVYSLGAILYEMLTGRPPFRADSSASTILQVLTEEPAPVRRLAPRVPRDLETICLKCLRKEPQHRYATAADLAEDLRRFQAGEPIAARPVGPLGRAWRWARRNRALAGTGALAAAALVTAAAVSAIAAVHNAKVARLLADQQKRTEAALSAEHAQRTRSNELAAGLLLDQSAALCQGGDVRAGLLWMTRCLQLAPPEATAVQWAARVNLSAWSREINAPSAPPLRHQGSVTAAAFSPDGALVLTGSEDQTARLWDARSGNPVARPLRHRAAVRAVAFSPDGSNVLTAGDDGVAQLWTTATGAPAGPTLQHQAAVRFALFTPNGQTVVTGSDDGTARLWETATGKPLGPPLDAGGPVAALAVSPNGQLLATAARSEVRLWTLSAATPATPAVATANPIRLDQPVLCVAFSPDGHTLATGGGAARAGSAQLCDAASGQPRGPALPHAGRVTRVAFQPMGSGAATSATSLLLTTCDDGAARLWDAGSGREVGLPLHHRENFPIADACFSADGRHVATASSDGSARVWNAATGRPVGTTINLDAPLHAVAFHPAGSTLLTGGDDQSARLWSVAPGQSVGPPVELRDVPQLSVTSADGRRHLMIDATGQAIVEDATTGRPLGPPLHHEGASPFERRVTCAALSPDGKVALTGGRDQTARLWQVATGTPIGPPLRHQGPVRAVAFSPDGRTVATGGDDKAVRLWTAEGQPLAPPGKPLPQRGPVRALAFSPDGRLLLAGCAYLQDGTWRGQGRVWDVSAGVAVGQPFRHQGPVEAVAFSPDGKVAATGSADRTAQFWEADGGRALGPPLEHSGAVAFVTFEPDGRTVTTLCRESAPGAATQSASRPAPETAPTGLAGLHYTWRAPAPLDGAADRLTVWAQVVTHLELDPANIVRRLDDETWAARRQQLESLGGPPGRGDDKVTR